MANYIAPIIATLGIGSFTWGLVKAPRNILVKSCLEVQEIVEAVKQNKNFTAAAQQSKSPSSI